MNGVPAVVAVVLGFFSTAVMAQDLPDHAMFTRVLEQYVDGDLVDYAELKAHRADLDAYLGALARTPAGAMESTSVRAKLAFWINAYNACALLLVIDHYPIKKTGFPASLVKSLQGVPANSIRQIPDTWKGEFCDVAGEPRALDEIEHEIIRPMGDPRIHFAVNCAALSCPVLASAAYTEKHLDEELDAAVQRLVTSPRHYMLYRDSKPRLRLNEVLDWYKDDFGGERGVVEFLMKHVAPDDAAYLRAHRDIRVEFFPYDWTLNDTAVFGASGHR